MTSLKLIQITDTHIYADTSTMHSGINNYTSLQQLLRQIKTNEWPFDAVIVTGDLSNDATADSYRLLHGLLAELKVPTFCLPGNHDDVNTMRAELDGETIISSERALLGEWQLIMIDSSEPGETAGHISDRQLFSIEKHLQHYTDRPVLIGMHHPPVTLQSKWLDAVGLREPERLLQMLERYRQVKALIFGHAHQVYSGQYAHIKIYGTPSTCRQFKPHSDEFALDSETPGYRILNLQADGTLNTSLKRITVEHQTT